MMRLPCRAVLCCAVLCMLCCAVQILLVNGLNAGSRPRKELLDRLAPGMRLFTPLCLLPDDGTGPGGSALPQAAAAAAAAAAGGQVPAAPQLPLDDESLASLGWTVAPPAGAAACANGSSCCALPAVRIHVPEGALTAMHVAPVPAPVAAQLPVQPAQPADSQATVASVGAAAGLLHNSPEVAQQPPQWLPVHRGQLQPAAAEAQGSQGGASGSGWGQQALQADAQSELEDVQGEQPAPPAWLAAGIASVGESSQGSADAVAGQQLLGRR